MTLGRKQSLTHEDFLAAWERSACAPPARAEERVSRAADAVRRFVGDKRAGYAWSGGKDSLALELVMRRAGVGRCALGMTDHLEYRAALRWVGDHMPAGIAIFKNRWDLKWLAAHPGMLFPKDCTVAAKWFAGVQRWAQSEFYEKAKLGVVITGNRRRDGNFVGKGGADAYEVRGMLRYNPLADWTHEDVFECLRLAGWTLETLPPFYRWPRGFRCGTHSWPSRQWCASVRHGWSEVYAIEPDRVREAAALIPSAADFLRSVG